MADPNLVGHIHGVGFAQFIKDYWPLGLAIIGFVVSILVVVKGKIPLLENRMEDAFNKLVKLEQGSFISKQTLFDKNNNFKFQTIPMCGEIREECQMHQKEYHDNFCKKLDNISFELKGIVADADKKREHTRFEITDMNLKLIETMTQMKSVIARDRKEETAEMIKSVVQQVVIQMRNNTVSR